MITTLDDFISQEIPKIYRCLREDENRGLMDLAANFLYLKIDERVFDEGIATDGDIIDSIVQASTAVIAAYADAYTKKRLAAGLQVNYIDLKFTGAFRDALTFGDNEDGNISVGFASQYGRDLREFHETYREKDIFLPTDEEIEDMVEFFNEEFPKFIDRCLGQN